MTLVPPHPFQKCIAGMVVHQQNNRACNFPRQKPARFPTCTAKKKRLIPKCLPKKCWSFEFGKKMQAFPSSVRTGRQRGAQWRGSSRQTVSWRRGCDTRLRKFCKVLANTLTWYKVPGSKSWKNKPNRNMLCTALSRANTVGARGRSRNNMEQLSSLKGAWISMFRACVMIRLACRKVCLGPKLHGLLQLRQKNPFRFFHFWQAAPNTFHTLYRNSTGASQLEYKTPEGKIQFNSESENTWITL